MKKYTYWIISVLVIGTVVYLISRPELEPQNLPKINYTQVETPAVFGELIAVNLKTEVKNSPVLLLGVTPDQVEDLEVWQAFLNANNEPGSKYDVVVVESKLPFIDLIASNLQLELKVEMDRFSEGIKAALSKNLRVAVILPNIYTSRLLERNPADILKNEKGIQFTSFSISKYPITIEQEASFLPACSVDSEDRDGTGSLGCMVRTKARSTYKIKLESGKYSGLMDQIDKNDYLILFNRN